jgi:predicted phosphoribosyltransferase
VFGAIVYNEDVVSSPASLKNICARSCETKEEIKRRRNRTAEGEIGGLKGITYSRDDGIATGARMKSLAHYDSQTGKSRN